MARAADFNGDDRARATETTAYQKAIAAYWANCPKFTDKELNFFAVTERERIFSAIQKLNFSLIVSDQLVILNESRKSVPPSLFDMSQASILSLQEQRKKRLEAKFSASADQKISEPTPVITTCTDEELALYIDFREDLEREIITRLRTAAGMVSLNDTDVQRLKEAFSKLSLNEIYSLDKFQKKLAGMQEHKISPTDPRIETQEVVRSIVENKRHFSEKACRITNGWNNSDLKIEGKPLTVVAEEDEVKKVFLELIQMQDAVFPSPTTPEHKGASATEEKEELGIPQSFNLIKSNNAIQSPMYRYVLDTLLKVFNEVCDEDGKVAQCFRDILRTNESKSVVDEDVLLQCLVADYAVNHYCIPNPESKIPYSVSANQHLKRLITKGNEFQLIESHFSLFKSLMFLQKTLEKMKRDGLYVAGNELLDQAKIIAASLLRKKKTPEVAAEINAFQLIVTNAAKLIREPKNETNQINFSVSFGTLPTSFAALKPAADIIKQLASCNSVVRDIKDQLVLALGRLNYFLKANKADENDPLFLAGNAFYQKAYSILAVLLKQPNIRQEGVPFVDLVNAVNAFIRKPNDKNAYVKLRLILQNSSLPILEELYTAASFMMNMSIVNRFAPIMDSVPMPEGKAENKSIDDAKRVSSESKVPMPQPVPVATPALEAPASEEVKAPFSLLAKWTYKRSGEVAQELLNGPKVSAGEKKSFERMGLLVVELIGAQAKAAEPKRLVAEAENQLIENANKIKEAEAKILLEAKKPNQPTEESNRANAELTELKSQRDTLQAIANQPDAKKLRETAKKLEDNAIATRRALQTMVDKDLQRLQPLSSVANLLRSIQAVASNNPRFDLEPLYNPCIKSLMDLEDKLDVRAKNFGKEDTLYIAGKAFLEKGIQAISVLANTSDVASFAAVFNNVAKLIENSSHIEALDELEGLINKIKDAKDAVPALKMIVPGAQVIQNLAKLHSAVTKRKMATVATDEGDQGDILAVSGKSFYENSAQLACDLISTNQVDPKELFSFNQITNDIALVTTDPRNVAHRESLNNHLATAQLKESSGWAKFLAGALFVVGAVVCIAGLVGSVATFGASALLGMKIGGGLMALGGLILTGHNIYKSKGTFTDNLRHDNRLFGIKKGILRANAEEIANQATQDKRLISITEERRVPR